VPDQPEPPPDGVDDRPFGGLTSEQFGLLASYLRESVILLDENWELVANLSAPTGLLGWGDPVGNHALAHIHPDDVLNFVDVGQGLTSTDPGWKGVAHLRLQRVDGTYARYETTMENLIHDPEVQGWIACTREVEGPAETAPEMEAAEVAASLLHALPRGVLVFGGTKVLFANDAACDVLGAESHQLAVRGLDDVADAASCEALERAVVRRGRAAGTEVVLLRPADGGPKRMEVSLTSTLNPESPSGRVLLVIGLVEDVTHEVARQEALEHRAIRDHLTGLYNRAWLLDELHDRLQTGRPVTIAYLDLCAFKLVNDQLGHRAGDRVLASIAEGLAATFGDEHVARVGGDEFIVLGPDPDHHRFGRFADEIILAVEEVAEAREHDVTGNVGVAVSSETDGPWSLIERADALMYEHKRADPHHRRHQG
jgi:diguanylate cyclase (GGDEF)-like protein